MESLYKNTPQSSDGIHEYSDDGWSESEWDDDEEIYQPIDDDYLEPITSKTTAPNLPVVQRNIPARLREALRSTFRARRKEMMFSLEKGKERIHNLRRQVPIKPQKKRPEIVHMIPKPPPRTESLRSSKLVPMSTHKPLPGFVRAQRVCRCANGCVCPSLIIFPPKEKQ